MYTAHYKTKRVYYFTINEKYSLVMEELSSGIVFAIAIVNFVVGFVFGYKVVKWRMKKMIRRRDRLASELAESQKMLEGYTTI
jgi:hypothetical protein